MSDVTVTVTPGSPKISRRLEYQLLFPLGRHERLRDIQGIDGPKPHKGLLNRYEGINITGEKVVNYYRAQLIDALIELYAVKSETGGSMWTGAGLRISFTG